MSYLLDTDIIIYWLNDAIPNIRNKINSIANDEIYISSITGNDKHFKRIEDLQVENWI